MSIIKIFMGNKKEKEADCCSVQIVEVSDKEETRSCETETSNKKQNC